PRPMQFDAVLRTFSELFEREGIRYAVVGGLAMQAWGHSRFTKDVDIAVARSNRQRVLEIAASLGYEAFFVSAGFSNHDHTDPAFGRLDFMYLDDATASRLFDASERKPIVGDVDAPVASPEHLAMMKGLAMRENGTRVLYEGEDVRHLLSLPGIDRAAVRDYFVKIGMLDLFDVIEKAR
ncbi:MAG: hypothetical protein JWO56_987, partial [Acidobacteria bacterium]|nr:hypothetical protein [Acidobacteriota bacterium]